MAGKLTLGLALALGAAVASADEIHLKNGNVVTGIAREDGDRVVVEMNSGTATLMRDAVVKIVPGRIPLHEYPERFAAIKDGKKAEDFFRLAVWCSKNRILRHERPLLKRVLELDPDHAGAREMLGYVRHEGRWLTREEHYKAQGLVRFRGKWIKVAERDAIVKKEAEERKTAAEESKKKEEPAAKGDEGKKREVLILGIQPVSKSSSENKSSDKNRKKGGKGDEKRARKILKKIKQQQNRKK